MEETIGGQQAVDATEHALAVVPIDEQCDPSASVGQVDQHRRLQEFANRFAARESPRELIQGAKGSSWKIA
jgi:hypothetical protein